MIDRETVQKIMDTANIVEVVSEFVTLRRAGVNYRGLCPFHDEKTPSFYVSPSRGICKCFSCGKGGNVVHFLMEHEQLSYPEALRWLAKKYNIEIHEKELTDEERQAASERESMFIINEWAAGFFQNILHNHADGIAIGMAYFRNRGFRDDTIHEFGLGFCPKERTALAEAARAKGFKDEYLKKTGLCYKRDDGKMIDRFSGRVIFPVHTVSGKIVAFGGRVLKTDEKIAKYVNSPESEIYNKRNELYGLYIAKHSIVKEDRCFLVEGYTDVISMHQSGIKNVVASSGTSLTPGQIRMIHRFTNNITVLYDGDAAGIKASLRGIDMLLSEGMNVKVVLLPDGDDPDSFARKNNATTFREYINSHQTDFITFKTELLMNDSANDPVGRAALVDNIVRSISVIPDKILCSMYVKECSRTMNVEESLLIDAVAKLKREQKQARYKEEKAGNIKDTTAESEMSEQVSEISGTQIKSITVSPTEKAERLLIQMIILYGKHYVGEVETTNGTTEMNVIDYIDYEISIDRLYFSNPLYKNILKEAVEHSHEENFSTRKYFLYHSNTDISQLAAKLESEKYHLSRNQSITVESIESRISEVIPQMIISYKLACVGQILNQILAKLANPEIANNEELQAELMSEYNEMKKVECALAGQAGDRVILS